MNAIDLQELSDDARGRLLAKIEEMTPQDLLQWSQENFGARAAIITSFQNTGCVMIDMASRLPHPLRVLTVDTLRLHPETYELIDRIEQRYDLPVERFKPDPERLERMTKRHGEYLFFDSEFKREHCCTIRKVEPNRRALATVDVWITGIRRDQSDSRGQAPRASILMQDGRSILKLAPLVDWTAEQVNEYMRANDVPYNALYDQNYTSIGCIVCSTPTLAGEDGRAGRWRWLKCAAAEKECGIHTDGGGI